MKSPRNLAWCGGFALLALAAATPAQEKKAAFKPIDQTHGRVLWEVEVPAAHGPVVADVDGDGLCEIVLGCTDGVVRVYK